MIKYSEHNFLPVRAIKIAFSWVSRKIRKKVCQFFF